MAGNKPSVGGAGARAMLRGFEAAGGVRATNARGNTTRRYVAGQSPGATRARAGGAATLSRRPVAAGAGARKKAFATKPKGGQIMRRRNK